MRTPRRAIVTSAPPNPNGDLHVGHLSGPFLGGDVQARYLRQRGCDVAYVSYADDLSCYVARRAGELGRGTEETAHLFGRRIEETFGLAAMVPDYFTHPLREAVHVEVVQRFFLQLWERDAFEVAELPVYWCPHCRRHLYEAEMRGRCQFCDAAADGLYCEECGRPQDTTGLVAARCTRCHSAPETRMLRRIAFRLDDHRPRLRAHYAGRSLRPRLRAFLDDLLARPLPLTPVSRESGYGIPVPLPGWEGHVLDTWYSGIWGYVAATVAYHTALGHPEAALEAWTDPQTAVVHFIGFDCSFSHAILWPALLLAHGGLRLPDHVVTNEFYRLEGEKFSTSRGTAIWGGDLLRRVPADPLRFYLCLTGPELEQTNFSVKDFAATVDGLLAGDLQRWVDTVLELARADFDGATPATEPGGGPLADVAEPLLADTAAAFEPASFSPRRVAATLRDAIGVAAADVPGLRAAGGGGDAAYAARLARHLDLLARVAVAAAPIMPTFAEQVWVALRLPFADDVRRVLPWPAGEHPLVARGQPIDTHLATLVRPVEPAVA